MRPSMFEKGGRPVHGKLSRDSARRFEAARKALSRLYRDVTGLPWKHVSDGDVLEYLLRGSGGTRDYLAARYGEQIAEG